MYIYVCVSAAVLGKYGLVHLWLLAAFQQLSRIWEASARLCFIPHFTSASTFNTSYTQLHMYIHTCINMCAHTYAYVGLPFKLENAKRYFSKLTNCIIENSLTAHAAAATAADAYFKVLHFTQ